MLRVHIFQFTMIPQISPLTSPAKQHILHFAGEEIDILIAVFFCSLGTKTSAVALSDLICGSFSGEHAILTACVLTHSLLTKASLPDSSPQITMNMPERSNHHRPLLFFFHLHHHLRRHHSSTLVAFSSARLKSKHRSDLLGPIFIGKIRFKSFLCNRSLISFLCDRSIILP